MIPDWVYILADAGYPTDVVVLDFESYHDSVYSLKKLSTIEYVTDPRWDELGLAVCRIPGAYPYSPIQGSFWVGPERADLYLDWLRSTYGKHLEGCTVVCHNASFDCQVLARHHNLVPRYVVDTLGLARHVNPHIRNRLEDLCKRYKLKEKGDTSQFSGLHWAGQLGPPTWESKVFTKQQAKKLPYPRKYISGSAKEGGIYQDVIRQGMDAQTRLALCEYARNDAERGFELFTILLPMLSRPSVELRLMRHTLGMFIEPCIGVDFDLGDRLVEQMDTRVGEILNEVKWVLDAD
jgi:hypothetical protein